MKRFNDSLYKDVYECFDALPNPITKIPIIKNYPEKGTYFNLLTGVYDEMLEGIMDKEDVEKKNYTFFKKTQSWTHFFDLRYIKKLDVLCLRAYAFCFDWDGNFTPFCLRSAKIFYKDKTILDMPEAAIYDKGKSMHFYQYVASNVFVDKKTTDFSTTNTTLYKAVENALKIGRAHLSYINCASYTQKMEGARKHDKVLGFNGEKWEDFAKIFSDFYGGNLKTVAAGRVIDITETVKNFGTFIHYKEPKGMKKEKVKENKYLSLSLPNIPYEPKYKEITGFAQSVTADVSVLRLLKKDDTKKEMIDISKIFIEKGKTVAFRQNDAGDWVKSNLSSILNWDFDVYGISEKALDKTLFRFTEDIVKDITNIPYASALAIVLGNPIIEQLYKTEAKDVIIDVLNNKGWSSNIKNVLKNSFGKIDYTKKSVHQKLGLNKYQFKKLVSIYNDIDISCNHDAFARIKRCFTPIDFNESRYWRIKQSNVFVDLSSIDNDTFDNVCNVIFKKTTGGRNNFEGILIGYLPYFSAQITTLYGIPSAIKTLNLFAETISLPEISGIDYSNGYRLVEYYSDYINMVNTISTQQDDAIKRFPPFFDPKHFVASITAMHNLVAEIATEIRNENFKIAFEKETQKLDKWTFNDKEFTVIRPKKMVDLTEEGIKLHHCVGGYIQRVANGVTNIMFIRKTEEVDKPFFTVEISNSGAIEQIHGLCNCNVEKGSNLEKFVQKWTKEKKLKTTYYDKIR